jgi:hypothetical protein
MPVWTNLFRFAAIFNWIAGLPLLLAPTVMLSTLGVEPPADLTFHRLSGLLIAFFGAVYWIIARDAVRFRPLAKLGVAGKVLVFALFAQGWVAGQAPDAAAGLAVGDLLFGFAFTAALWVTRDRAA